MFAHGDDDLREPVYDLTSTPGATSAAPTAIEKIAFDNEQSYHLDAEWNGKFMTSHVCVYFDVADVT